MINIGTRIGMVNFWDCCIVSYPAIYSGTSDNGLLLLRKPPLCRRKRTVRITPYSLLCIVTSVQWNLPTQSTFKASLYSRNVKFSNTWHTKSCHITGCTLCKKDMHLSIADTSIWSWGVGNSEVPLYNSYMCWIGPGMELHHLCPVEEFDHITCRCIYYQLPIEGGEGTVPGNSPSCVALMQLCLLVVTRAFQSTYPARA